MKKTINALQILKTSLFIFPFWSSDVITRSVSAGYLLADDPQGETPLIPSEVMEFSIKHSTEVDINTTLQILGSPGEKASSIPGFNRTDSVIRYQEMVSLSFNPKKPFLISFGNSIG